ncbi:MAG: flagellar motor protein MotB [Alphaproteobacteria bacterium]|nr:flagellar motor protein MotB [Alphaproteobacteria bacterium]
MAKEKKKDQKKKEEKASEQPIIIKKIKKGGGHHGGAWKVAYADFVTAMMAFFLLLWLLNVSTKEELNALANYFDPTHPKVSAATSGAGGVMGGLSLQPQGAKSKASKTKQKMDKIKKDARIEKAKAKRKKKESDNFKTTKKELKEAILKDAELASMVKNIIIDITPEGLRIQIVDEDGEPMFASGSSKMFEKTHTLISKISKIIQPLTNEISVRGHTDSVPYGNNADYTNWELSTDRANASRRVLLESGLSMNRLNNVIGKADTEPLIPDAPDNAKNRRISILLLKEELTNPDYDKLIEEDAMDAEYEDDLENEEEDIDEFNSIPNQIPVGTFRKTPGEIQFP